MLPGAREAGTSARHRCKLVYTLAIQQNGARIGADVAGDQIEQRGLARPVGSDQAEDVSGLERQSDVVGDDDAAERLAQAHDLENGAHQTDPALTRWRLSAAGPSRPL